MAPSSDFGRRGGAIFTGKSPFFGRPPGFEARGVPLFREECLSRQRSVVKQRVKHPSD
jgi:hypothetical protein